MNKNCPRCNSDEIVGIKYTNKYAINEVSEFVCSDCGRREGRFCKRELVDSEVEPPYCDSREHPRIILL